MAVGDSAEAKAEDTDILNQVITVILVTTIILADRVTSLNFFDFEWQTNPPAVFRSQIKGRKNNFTTQNSINTISVHVRRINYCIQPVLFKANNILI